MSVQLTDEAIRVKRDVEVPSLAPQETGEALEALEKLAQQVAGQGAEPPAQDAEPPKQDAEPPKQEAEPPAQDAEPPKQEAEPPAQDAEPPKQDAEPPKQEVEPPKAEPDPFEQHKLPPTARAKSAEAFEKLKTAAREMRQQFLSQVSELRQKVEELTRELEAAKTAQQQLPPEVERELDELRKFRLAKDAEYDPVFRQFQTKVEQNNEAIYRKLAAAGVSQEHIQKIKDLGGPDEVDWQPILEKLPVPVARYIEAKLVENETLREQRQEALEKARADAKKYEEELAKRRVAEVWEKTRALVEAVPELQPKPIPPGLSPEERKTIETHNKAIQTLLAQVRDWVSDISPERIAELAAGTALAYRYRNAVQSAQKMLEDLNGKLAALTKERDTLRADLERLRAAERPASRNTAMPAPPVKKSLLNLETEEVLDLLAKQVGESV